jgi:D-amino peptidase
MKILISADMEGVCGVSSWVQVTPPENGGEAVSTQEYERARARLMREVNAAIEGALQGGATDIVVNDSHDGMRNLLAEELHPAARFISGSDKPFGMVQGVGEGVAALFFVGYHAKAGTPGAPLAHTWTGYLQDVRYSGASTGEYGLNATLAGHFGVPVAFVSGDDKAVAQVQEQLGRGIVGVAVKEGISTFSALHLHPEEAQARIRTGAEQALRHLDALEPYRPAFPTVLELEFDHQARADQCLYLPGVRRLSDRSVACEVADALHLNQVFRAMMKLSSIRFSP